MISIQAKQHDNFSVEFKFGYNCMKGGSLPLTVTGQNYCLTSIKVYELGFR